MKGEIWRDIPGWEGLYTVSNHGNIRGHKGQPIKHRPNAYGYPHFSLCRKGYQQTCRVHVIVMEAFVGPRPAGLQIDHMDGNRQNNRLDNLRYCTAKENAENKVERGAQATGINNGWGKLSPDQIKIIHDASRSGKRFWGRNDLAKRFGVHPDHITKILRVEHSEVKRLRRQESHPPSPSTNAD